MTDFGVDGNAKGLGVGHERDGRRRSFSRKLVAFILLFWAVGCVGRDQSPATKTPPSPLTGNFGSGRGNSAPSYHFVDVTRRAGLPTAPKGSWGVLWTDYDGNGYPDLFLGRHGHGDSLYPNDKGAFERLDFDFHHPKGYVSTDRDYWVDRHSCAWGEANGDGRPDLYCGQGANVGQGTGPNQLLIQTTQGFEDYGRRYHVTDQYGRARSLNWLDHDGDGDLDLFIGNALRHGYPNVLFENREDGFQRVAVGLEQELATMSSSWADWDIDGDPDLLVFQYPYRPAYAYQNVDGKFTAVDTRGITGEPWHAAAWGDYDGNRRSDLALVSLDEATILRNGKRGFRVVLRIPLKQGRMSLWLDVENDGDLDLFVVQGATGAFGERASNRPDFLLIQHAGGFRRLNEPSLRGATTGKGDGVAAADYNRDGRVDLFLTNGDNEAALWEGKGTLLENRSNAGNWVAIDLRGERTNPWGIGASVLVDTKQLRYWRESNDGLSFRSQSEVGHLVLGIGQDDTARIRVVWPEGVEDCLSIRNGMTIPLEIGSSPCPSP